MVGLRLLKKKISTKKRKKEIHKKVSEVWNYITDICPFWGCNQWLFCCLSCLTDIWWQNREGQSSKWCKSNRSIILVRMKNTQISWLPWIRFQCSTDTWWKKGLGMQCKYKELNEHCQLYQLMKSCHHFQPLLIKCLYRNLMWERKS